MTDAAEPRTTGRARPAVRPPSLLLGALEQQRALAELVGFGVSLPLFRLMPAGDGHPVLVLPGFMADDWSTVALRSVLRSRGYEVHRWGLGRNLGPRAAVVDGLVGRLDAIHRDGGRSVSLVGWSLGGIYARALARWRPHAVRRVITLGSPFRMRPGDRSNASRLFQRLNPAPDLPHPVALEDEPLSVPSTAIYTRTDGVARWHLCIEAEHPRAENIEVRGSHCGLGHNPAVILAIADRLAEPEGSFRRFRPPRGTASLYPAPTWWRAAGDRAGAA
ncbi:MAG: esterase/lipase family protein [Acidimicrobiales bacterium]